MLLLAPGLKELPGTISNKELLGAPGIAARSKDASRHFRSKEHAPLFCPIQFRKNLTFSAWSQTNILSILVPIRLEAIAIFW